MPEATVSETHMGYAITGRVAERVAERFEKYNDHIKQITNIETDAEGCWVIHYCAIDVIFPAPLSETEYNEFYAARRVKHLLEESHVAEDILANTLPEE